MSRSTTSQQRPIVLGRGEGYTIPGPEGITLKATRDDTGGSVGFLEATSQPGFAAPRHIHHTADELFYVLDGEFEFELGEQTVRASAGSFVFIPRGMVHAPKVVGDREARVLSAFVPGGNELSFEEFARLASTGDPGAPPAMADFQKIAAKYDSEFVAPLA